MTTQERARERAAQIWCEPQHAHKEMDADLAESIAHALADAEARECLSILEELDKLGGLYASTALDAREGMDRLEASSKAVAVCECKDIIRARQRQKVTP